MQKVTLQANPRTITGHATKSLRRQGILPAVIYGHSFAPINVQVSLGDFIKAYSAAGASTLVYLQLADQSYPIIVHEVARDPVTDAPIHADFYKVRLDEKIKANIPVVIVGESPAVKSLGGILLKNINEIEVEGFPQDLPHQFDVDISGLAQFRDHIQVKDLAVPANVEIKANPDDIIALIQEPISEEKLKESLETAPTPSAEDVEVIKKEKKEEEAPEPATEQAGPSADGKEETKKAQ